MPMKLNVRELEDHRKPKSDTRKFSVIVPEVGTTTGVQPVAGPAPPGDFEDEIPF
jgi:hypothetical protein